MSKNKQADRDAEAKETEEKVVVTDTPDTGTETSSEGGEDEEMPAEYKAPTQPGWIVPDVHLALVAGKASQKGVPDGITYQAELLTLEGVKALVVNNPALAQSLINNQVKAHVLAGLARKFGEGVYAYGWGRTPGQRLNAEDKEKAIFWKKFDGKGKTEEQIQALWEQWQEMCK